MDFCDDYGIAAAVGDPLKHFRHLAGPTAPLGQSDPATGIPKAIWKAPKMITCWGSVKLMPRYILGFLIGIIAAAPLAVAPLAAAQSLSTVADPPEEAWMNTAEIFEAVVDELQIGFYQNQDIYAGPFYETHDSNADTTFFYTDPETGKQASYDGIWTVRDDQICYYYQEEDERISHCQFVRQWENCLYFYSIRSKSGSEAARSKLQRKDFAAGDWMSVRYIKNETPKCVAKIS